MSDNYSLIIKNGSCYIGGKFQKTDIALLGNKIKKIGKIDLNSSKVIEASGKVVLPGVIDTQVHFREPGGNNAENLETGSRAAVAEKLHQFLRCQIPIPQLQHLKNFIIN